MVERTFLFVERFGIVLVGVAFVGLAVGYAWPFGGADVLPIGLGLGAVVTAYLLVRAALPDCGLMAVATAATVGVMPGHVAAVATDPWMGVAEVAAGILLIGLVRLIRGVMSIPPEAAPSACSSALAAAVLNRAANVPSPAYRDVAGSEHAASYQRRHRTLGGMVVLTVIAISLLSLISAMGTTRSPFFVSGPHDVLSTVEGAVGSVWIGDAVDAVAPVAWALAIITLLAAAGAVRYGVFAFRRDPEAGLTEQDRVAFVILYAAAATALVWAFSLAFSETVRLRFAIYPFIAPLALIGIIGFETWFPLVLRPLVVFMLLAALFALAVWSLVGLFTI